jgi:hypothetical protein
MKTTQEKIDEKKKTLDEINDTLKKSMTLYDITTLHFGNVFAANSGKIDTKQTISGIASLLSKINEMLVTRNSIENEINSLLELEEQQSSETSSDRVKGSKAEILTLMAGAKKEIKAE